MYLCTLINCFNYIQETIFLCKYTVHPTKINLRFCLLLKKRNCFLIFFRFPLGPFIFRFTNMCSLHSSLFSLYITNMDFNNYIRMLINIILWIFWFFLIWWAKTSLGGGGSATPFAQTPIQNKPLCYLPNNPNASLTDRFIIPYQNPVYNWSYFAKELWNLERLESERIVFHCHIGWLHGEKKQRRVHGNYQMSLPLNGTCHKIQKWKVRAYSHESFYNLFAVRWLTHFWCNHCCWLSSHLCTSNSL